MKLTQMAGLFALGIAATGCATIVKGTTQSVSVASSPDQGAACTLTNTQGTWYVTTPGSVTVGKTKNDLIVHCTKPGYLDATQTITADFGAATFGNIIAGGIIGAGVDAASGANYTYKTPITIPMAPTPPPAPEVTTAPTS